jgi:hypothetical protein
MLAGIGPVCAHQPGAGLAAPAGFYSPHPALQRQGLHRVLERLPLVPHTRTGQGPRGRVLRRILRLGQHVHSRRRLHHHCRPGSALGDRVDGRALNRSPGSFVVVATTTTQECRRCHNDDKHVREVVVPPATLATGITTATQYQPEPDDDHGTTAGGVCNAKSEITDPADQASRLVIEWTADLSQPLSGQALRASGREKRSVVWVGDARPHGKAARPSAQGGRLS